MNVEIVPETDKQQSRRVRWCHLAAKADGVADPTIEVPVIGPDGQPVPGLMMPAWRCYERFVVIVQAIMEGIVEDAALETKDASLRAASSILAAEDAADAMERAMAGRTP